MAGAGARLAQGWANLAWDGGGRGCQLTVRPRSIQPRPEERGWLVGHLAPFRRADNAVRRRAGAAFRNPFHRTAAGPASFLPPYALTPVTNTPRRPCWRR